MGLIPPDDLGPEARAVWDRIGPELDELGLVGPVDLELVRAWCQTVAELRAAEAWVAEHGTTFTLRDDKGAVRSMNQTPKYAQARALRSDLVKLAGELGLSPRARAGLPDTPEAEGENLVDALERIRADRAARTGTGGVPDGTEGKGKPRAGSGRPRRARGA